MHLKSFTQHFALVTLVKSFAPPNIKMLPPPMSSMVLTKMRETAEAYLGKTVTGVIITVPA